MKIVYAKLHEPLFHPTVGETGRTLESKDTNAVRGTDMTLNGSLVELIVRAKHGPSKVKMLVPVSSFVLLVPEDQK